MDRERAVAHDDCEILRFALGERAGDLHVAPGDARVYLGRRLHHTVELDRDETADERPSDLAKEVVVDEVNIGDPLRRRRVVYRAGGADTLAGDNRRRAPLACVEGWHMRGVYGALVERPTD